jgi:hypothetical protein
MSTEIIRYTFASPLLSIQWGKLPEETNVFFDGKAMPYIDFVMCRASSATDRCFMSIVLVQTPEYKQPQDFVDELLNCGFTVTVVPIDAPAAQQP